jgi:hypothetical protein
LDNYWPLNPLQELEEQAMDKNHSWTQVVQAAPSQPGSMIGDRKRL